MSSIDTYKTSKKAINAGFTKTQTGFMMCLVSQFQTYLYDNFVTKNQLDTRIEKIENKIQMMEKNLIIKIGAMMFAMSAIIISTITLIIKLV
jgi:hypothetical protein